MLPHKMPNHHKKALPNIALCLFFASLSLICLRLAQWQYHKGRQKECDIVVRSQAVSFDIVEPRFFIAIEEPNRAISSYILGLTSQGCVAISADLVNKGKNIGYWHPIERNIFQSETIIEKNEDCCVAYSLFACQNQPTQSLTGIIKDAAWQPSIPPLRHNAYAFQWAALAALGLLMTAIHSKELILRLTNVLFDTSSTAGKTA